MATSTPKSSPATHAAIIICIVVAFYILSAPALQAYAYARQLYRVPRPLSVKLIDSYNIPLLLAYDHIPPIRKPLDAYLNWVIELLRK